MLEKQFLLTHRFSAKTARKVLWAVIKDYQQNCELGFTAAKILRDIADNVRLGIKHDIDPFITFREVAQLADLQRMICLYEAEELSKWEFSMLYQLRDLFRKYQDSQGADERKRIALNKFLECEEKLSQFDIRSIKWSDDDFTVDVFSYARAIIARVLGTEPVINHRFYKDCRHGPGANLGHRGSDSAKFDKYAVGPYHVSSKALRYARRLVLFDERWREALVDNICVNQGIALEDVTDEIIEEQFFYINDSNSVEFVPKDGTTDRSIAIEPDLNLMLQLGVDGFIRRGLKQHMNIDLNDQSRNQYLASAGSINGSVSTLDLSSASDTISLALCEFLLPSRWFSFLCDLRSPSGVIAGLDEPLDYLKISSMGNGYTFALESLIFASIAYGVARAKRVHLNAKNFHVYGDDIIVPTAIAHDVMSQLETAGFSINIEKSFVDGPFRESCGADFLRGTNVRPVSQKWEIETTFDLLQLTNKLLGRLEEDLYINRFDTETFKLMKTIWKKIDKCSGPVTEDAYTYLHDPNYRARKGVYKWKTYSLEPRKKFLKFRDYYFVKLLASLHSQIDADDPLRVDKQRQMLRRQYWQKVNGLRPDSDTSKRNALDYLKSPIGVFDVVRKNAYDVSINFRHSPQWVVESINKGF